MSYACGVVEVTALHKTYRVHRRPPGVWAALRSVFHRHTEPVHAVADLSFRIAEGERVGFLGPNGAGKTTTIQMLLDVITPDSGQIEVFGLSLPKHRETILEQTNFSSSYVS